MYDDLPELESDDDYIPHFIEPQDEEELLLQFAYERNETV